MSDFLPPVLTESEIADMLSLTRARMTDMVDIEAWWGQRGATTENYVGSHTPADAPNPPIPAVFKTAADIHDVPCRVAPTSGTTYSDPGGRSYSVSGITVYVPVGVTRYAIYTFGQDSANLYYYGHFVQYDGRAWRIETMNVMGTTPAVGVLNCVEAARELDVDAQAALVYLMDSAYEFIHTSEWEDITV